jgi:hypothetical protein
MRSQYPDNFKEMNLLSSVTLLSKIRGAPKSNHYKEIFMFMPTVMPMPINQTGHEVIPGAFKYLGASRIFAVSNFDDSALIDENIGSFQLAELRIHGENIRAPDQRSAHGRSFLSCSGTRRREAFNRKRSPRQTQKILARYETHWVLPPS